MQTLDFKISGRRARSFCEDEPRTLRHHTWVAIAVAAVGAGTAIYGANKQAKAVSSAAATNAGLQDQTNQSAWDNWLMTRGVNPEGAATGVIPNNPQPINTRLPLWASVKRPGAVAAGFRIPGRTVAPSLAVTTGFNQPASTADQLAAGAGGTDPSKPGVADYLNPTSKSGQAKVSTAIGQFFNPFDSSKDLFGLFG